VDDSSDEEEDDELNEDEEQQEQALGDEQLPPGKEVCGCYPIAAVAAKPSRTPCWTSTAVQAAEADGLPVAKPVANGNVYLSTRNTSQLGVGICCWTTEQDNIALVNSSISNSSSSSSDGEFRGFWNPVGDPFNHNPKHRSFYSNILRIVSTTPTPPPVQEAVGSKAMPHTEAAAAAPAPSGKKRKVDEDHKTSGAALLKGIIQRAGNETSNKAVFKVGAFSKIGVAAARAAGLSDCYHSIMVRGAYLAAMLAPYEANILQQLASESPGMLADVEPARTGWQHVKDMPTPSAALRGGWCAPAMYRAPAAPSPEIGAAVATEAAK
jgi:hypothetical protein